MLQTMSSLPLRVSMIPSLARWACISSLARRGMLTTLFGGVNQSGRAPEGEPNALCTILFLQARGVMLATWAELGKIECLALINQLRKDRDEYRDARTD